MIKHIVYCSIFLLSGCSFIYDKSKKDFVIENPSDRDLSITEQAINHIIELYPPAKTNFYIHRNKKIQFEEYFINSLRFKGYGIRNKNSTFFSVKNKNEINFKINKNKITENDEDFLVYTFDIDDQKIIGVFPSEENKKLNQYQWILQQ
jgi:hypothetical protein